MNVYSNKTGTLKSETAGHPTQQLKTSSQVLQDNRPQAVIQGKLMNSSDGGSSQLKSEGYLVNNRPIQKKANNTGLPDHLKTGIESMSGLSMDDVKVHYNSDKPAQLKALAYAQGQQIHVAPGQEKHLPHEAWHVVQQKQGRVKPTLQMKGMENVNDNVGLEQEADVMGSKALQLKPSEFNTEPVRMHTYFNTLQRKVGFEMEFSNVGVTGKNGGGNLSKANALIKSNDDYIMNVDELSNYLDVEYVIREIDEDDPDQRNTAIKSAAAAWGNQDALYDAAADNRPPFRAKSLGGYLNTIKFIKKIARASCRLQATAGLDLIALAKISTIDHEDESHFKDKVTAKVNPEGKKRATAPAITSGSLSSSIINAAYRQMYRFTTSLGLQKEIPAESFVPWVKVLAVLAGHLIQTPLNSRLEAGDYPKAAAGPLLNRSDYAFILKILPPEIHAFLKKFAYTWSLYLITILDEILVEKRPKIENHISGDGGNRKYYGNMQNEDSLKHNTHSDRQAIHRESTVLQDNWKVNDRFQTPDYSHGLKLTQWYESLVRKEVDYLTKATYPGGAEQKEYLESMGGYGNKFDTPPEGTSIRPTSRPLFEFRRLDSVDDIDTLVQQMEAILELVSMAHKENTF